MDLHSKKIIGYAYSKSMAAELAVKSIENECLNVWDTTGIIEHSDLGTQYTCKLFEDCLIQNHKIHSYSRKGNPYDNACIESFHATIKERGYPSSQVHDFQMAGRSIFEYIEFWYNRKRIHSSLNYMIPQACEDDSKAVA